MNVDFGFLCKQHIFYYLVQIIEFVLADLDRVLFLNALGDQLVQNAGITQLRLEILQALVVLDVRTGEDTLQPRASTVNSWSPVRSTVNGRVGWAFLSGRLCTSLIDLDRGQILQAVVDQRGQVVHTLTGRRGDGQEGQTLGLDVLLELLDLLGACNVALVAQHDLRTVRQLGTEPGQLVVDLLKVRLGVAALAAGDVNDVQQQAAALNMAQEVVAEADTLRSTLDQTGMSAQTKLCSGPTRTTPSTGVSVVKW